LISFYQPAICPGSPGYATIPYLADPNDSSNNWRDAHWTITNGSITYQTTTSASFITNPAGGPATLTVTAADSYGCIASASASTTVNVLTPPEITTASPDVCPTSEVHATVARPQDPNDSWTNYSWSATNATITSINPNSSDIFAMATGEGPVTLTVTVTDMYGCTVTSTKTVPLTSN